MPDSVAVMVRVTSTDEARESVTLSTSGALEDGARGWTLRYDETSPDSLASVQTAIECRKSQVTIRRSGGVVSTIVFVENETFMGEYQTPLGLFWLRVFPTEVSVRRRGNAGRIRLAYEVHLSSRLSPAGETAMRRLDIRFTPCK